METAVWTRALFELAECMGRTLRTDMCSSSPDSYPCSGDGLRRLRRDELVGVAAAAEDGDADRLFPAAAAPHPTALVLALALLGEAA